MVDRGCRRAPNMARWALGYVQLGRGEVDEARRVLDEALAFGDRSEMIEWRLPPRWGLAEAALVAGEPAKAIALCEEAFTLALAQNERALLTPFVVTGVRAYQAAGRPADADRWLAACTERLAPTPAFARPALEHAQGLVSLAAGSTGVARTCLETAVAGWDERGRIWEACWARLDLAAAQARSNRYAAAVALAGQVRETASRLPSPILVARADELVRDGSRPRHRGRAVAPADGSRVRGRPPHRRGPHQRRDRRGARHRTRRPPAATSSTSSPSSGRRGGPRSRPGRAPSIRPVPAGTCH